jgi:hypothetical protein
MNGTVNKSWLSIEIYRICIYFMYNLYLLKIKYSRTANLNSAVSFLTLWLK